MLFWLALPVCHDGSFGSPCPCGMMCCVASLRARNVATDLESHCRRWSPRQIMLANLILLYWMVAVEALVRVHILIRAGLLILMSTLAVSMCGWKTFTLGREGKITPAKLRNKQHRGEVR
jgi:hypothetical protein